MFNPIPGKTYLDEDGKPWRFVGMDGDLTHWKQGIDGFLDIRVYPDFFEKNPLTEAPQDQAQ